jgi:hypothetical protein
MSDHTAVKEYVMPWQCAGCKSWCPDTTLRCEHCGEVYDETKYVDVSRLHPLAQKRFYEQLESQRNIHHH